MPVIQVLIFRGTGGVLNKNSPHYNEPALVKAGHVGVSGIIEGKIIGFSPTPEATEALGGVEALIKELENYRAQPGRLQDDDAYFKRAYELIEETNGRTTVYTYEVEISEETLLAIQSWYYEGKEALYNFPNRGVEFQNQETNCAMFWVEWFRIPLPRKTGSIRELTSHMDKQEYDKWQND